MKDASRIGSPRRARRSFWILVMVAVLASGSLSIALASDPGPVVGLRVAASGLVLVASVALAARVLAAVDRVERRATVIPEHQGRRTRRTDEQERR